MMHDRPAELDEEQLKKRRARKDHNYRSMMYSDTQSVTLFDDQNPLRMDSGALLSPVTVAYETYGSLNADGTNAVLVCHALTGSAHAADHPDTNGGPAGNSPTGEGWWNGAIGRGLAFDPSGYFIISSNILGSCYGTTGPLSIDAGTGRPYRMSFPQMTVRDMVRVQHALVRYLGVNRLAAVTGGSLGGMQALEWAVMYPEMVQRLIPIATASRHTAWGIGLNEAARLAIMGDPAWRDGNYEEQPAEGLALARMIAMISYRSAVSYEQKFGRKEVLNEEDIRAGALFPEALPRYQIENYLRYQGQKLVNRFDANTYIYLSRALDAHDISAGRGKTEEVLGSIRAKTLGIGISSDILYPPPEQRAIATAIPGSRYVEIDSIHGHDAFLIEYAQLNRAIREFMQGQ